MPVLQSSPSHTPTNMLASKLAGAVTFNSLPPCDLSACSKKDIKNYFENTYSLNESLFTSLKDDSVFMLYPDRLRLPLIFYFAHTASVYVNKLILAGLMEPSERVCLDFETLFETGVDEMSWDDTENYRMGGKFEWPGVEEVVEYRQKVKDLILKVIDRTPLQLPVNMESPWWGLFMGMEHERIHIETSSVLIRQLPVIAVNKPDKWIYAPAKWGQGVKNNAMIPVKSQTVSLGKPEDFPSFGWDNEYGQLEINVPAFEASKYPVTNGEFLAFVKAGGYNVKEHWSDEGWEWVQFRHAQHPTFWICNHGCASGCGADLKSYSHCKSSPVSSTETKPCYSDNGHPGDDIVCHLINGKNAYCNGHSTVDDNGHQGKDEGGGYKLRCMFDEIPMPWDWPVEVNYHEAKAFCHWKGQDYRLPTEAEYHAMRASEKGPQEGVSCDIIYKKEINANLNLKYGSSTPVNMFSANKAGFCDLFGNVWEWCEDHFNGLPGFKTSYLYDDFSSPCFDGRHNIILGGSWISTGDEASCFARYAFRRHFFQHCGFRVARSIHTGPGKVLIPAQLVNTEVYISGAGVMGNPDQLNPDHVDVFYVPSTNVQLVNDTEEQLELVLSQEYRPSSSSSLILSQKCLDAVQQFGVALERAAHIGCGTGRVAFELSKVFQEILGCDTSARCMDSCISLQKDKTFTFHDVTASVPPNCEPQRIVFKQFTWLPNEVKFFDFILLSLLDRALNPHAWLVRMNEILRFGGLLAISSSGHWGAAELQDYIGHQFCLVHEEILTCGKEDTKLTFWQHK